MVKSANGLDYIRAEFYKALHRKYTWWFLIAILAGAGALVGAWVYGNSLKTMGTGIDFSTGATMLVMLLSVGVYCTLITGDIAFSDQYKHNTLKNEVSYGVPRMRIYLGKFFVSGVVSVVVCAILTIFYLALCWVVLPHDPKSGEAMKMVGAALLNALPLWLGAQAMVMLCLSIFKSSTVGSFAFIGIIMLLPQGLKLLGMLVDPVFLSVREFMLTVPFENPDFMVSMSSLGRSVTIGAIWFVAATVAGMLTFQKREIN